MAPLSARYTVNVSITGGASFSDTNSEVTATSANTQDWKQFTHTFVATSGATTLTFLNGDPSNDNNNGLDNVARTDGVIGAVPEPTSAALVVSGLLGLGLLTRRKRSKSILRRALPRSVPAGTF